MSKKKKYISYPKERAVLADVLPYETPITFSNRHFYNFLVKNNIGFNGSKIIFKNSFSGDDLKAFESILAILFATGFATTPNPIKIPFIYKICHKENDFRELAVIHPMNQLKLIEFYETYKELIIYYCSVSNYSIRKPVDVAKFTFFNDQLHQENKGDKNDFLELSGREYENLKTYFSYKNYTNIFRFYEDYRYQRAEKKYKLLYKFDIIKCFDSIYTHSITWAVLGTASVKENVNISNKSFAGKFDEFIRNANYNETNGILIGPEFSRIFSEIILQRIDLNIENKLKARGKYLKKDYELYRYVDDYFLFCDDDKLREDIVTLFKHELKLFKMSISDAKSKKYEKPIITEITVAKQKILSLLKNAPDFNININEAGVGQLKHTFDFFFNPNDLVTEYKIIIQESKVQYRDVLNYTLAILNNKVESNLTKFDRVYKTYVELHHKKLLSDSEIVKLRKIGFELTNHLENFIDFVFFIYSVSPRVNSTIKVSHILSKIIKFYKSKYKIEMVAGIEKISKFDISDQERIFKKILDESTFILTKNCFNEYTQVESIYLLNVLKDLGKNYRLSQTILAKIFDCIDLENSMEIKIKKGCLNYFSIISCLFYIGKSDKFPTLKSQLLIYILEYVNIYPKEKRGKSSEMCH